MHYCIFFPLMLMSSILLSELLICNNVKMFILVIIPYFKSSVLENIFILFTRDYPSSHEHLAGINT